MNGKLFLMFAFFLIHFVVNDDSDLHDITVAEGDTVQLKCDRNTDTAVDWKYHGRNEETSQYLCIAGHLLDEYTPKIELNSIDFTLVIHSVTVNDSGAYSCIEDYGLGEIHDMHLTVVRLVTVAEGDLVHLQCDRANDNPVDWRHHHYMTDSSSVIVIGGHLLDEYQRRFQVNPIDFTLTINSVTLNDSGFYSCVKDSGIGETHLVKLVVAGRTSSLMTTAQTTASTLALDGLSVGLFVIMAIIIAFVAVIASVHRLYRKASTKKTRKQPTDIELLQLKGEPCHGDRPLNDSELCHIEFNTPRLVELIDPNEDFLTELVSVRCIMRRDKEHIMAMKDRRQKNQELLDVLKGKNYRHLKKFVQCLSSNQQKHLSHLLVDTGVLVNVDATLDKTSVNDVDQTERQIVSTFQQTTLANVDEQINVKVESIRKEAEEKIRELGVDVDLVMLRVQCSIGCYFFCRTSNSLHHLFVLYGNKELRQILESIFNILLRADQRVRIIRLVWMINSYLQCTQYFTRQSRHDGHAGSRVRQIAILHHVHSSPKVLIYSRDKRKPLSHLCMSPKVLVYRRQRKSPSHRCMSPKVLVYRRQEIRQINVQYDITSMKVRKQEPAQLLQDIHSLPQELHEMILLSSLCLLTKTRLSIDPRPHTRFALNIETRAHVIAFKTLSSVCQYYHQTITKRKWFRRQLRRQLTVACRPYRLQPTLLHRLVTGQRGRVIGVTKLNNKLYIMHDDSTTIIVYTAHQPYRQLAHIDPSTWELPQDFAADITNSCLYVADPPTGVWRLRADHKVDKWIDIVNANRVSVTLQGHLVILIAIDVQGSKGNQIWHGLVEVYSADKLKLTVLKLPHDIMNAQDVVQRARRSFIVCHGTRMTRLHRVVEVNTQGSVVRSYGGPCGGGLGQLNMPSHIALDADERVLVTDTNNHRVMLLNENLNIERVLLTWSGLDDIQSPDSIYYDRENSQLLVGLKDGHIDIYSV